MTLFAGSRTRSIRAERILSSRKLSLAIVGADHPNKRGPTRRFAIALLDPGDPVELKRESRNPFDEYAIAVFDGKGVQLGYVRSERAAWLAPQLDRGAEVLAIFQESTAYGCVVRIALNGEVPSLPQRRQSPRVDQDFWPHPDWPD